MPQRSVATNYTFEQQRTEINLLAADFWSQKGTVDTAASTYLKHDGSNDFTGGTLAVPAAFTINSNSGAGTVTIAGNLQVDGTTTTVNTATMDVVDKNITIAKGSSNDAAADGAGITIDSVTDITWNFVDAKDAWVSSIGVEGTTFVKGPYGQFTGSGTPTTGQGVEVNAPDANTGQIISYDRGNTAYKDLRIKGSSVGVYTGTTNALIGTFNSTGLNVDGVVTADDLIVTGTSVVGDFKSTNNNYVLGIAGNNASDKAYIGTDSSGDFLIATGSGVDERLRITNTGLVTQKGTWTNTYAANDTTQCGYQTHNLSDTTNTYAALRLTAGSSSPATAQIASVRTGTGQNDLTIQLESSNTAFEALRIKSNGNVGINNDNPTVKLAVDGGTTSDLTTVQIKNDSTSAYATTDGGLNTSLSLFSDGTNAAQSIGIQLYLQKSGETGCISEIGATRESSGNSNLVFRTRDSSTGVNERMRITSGGRVYIGTTSASPANSYSNNLVVSEASGDAGISIHGNNSNSNYASLYFGDAGAVSRAYFESQLGSGTSTNFTIGAQGDTRFLNNGAERFRITSLGNFNIGTNGSYIKENQIYFKPAGASYIDQATVGQNLIFRTSDANSLDVTAGYLSSKGTLSLSGAGNSRAFEINAGGGASSLVFDRNGHITSNIRAGDGYSNVSGGSGGGSRITLNKEYMQFWTYPYVSGYIEPTYDKRFQVDTGGVTNYGSGNGNGAYHFTNTTANTNRHVEHTFGRVGGSNRGNTACVYIGENSSAEGEVLVVTSGSNGSLGSGVSIKNNETAWSAYSDTRLKNKISDITNALTGISQIDTWKYSMKDDSTNEPKLGVTAQSVQSVYPEVISQRDRITDDTDDTEYLQVAYTELIPVCIAAIKELKSKVETLEAEVTTLKSA